jgi:UDP-3-O-[3-hydroxymyristoyl] N-acetylglucosamine deacetylase
VVVDGADAGTPLLAAAPDSRADPSMQSTLAAAVGLSGVGVHAGRAVRLSLLPAPADSGIVFEREDLAPGQAEIRAHWRQVVDTRLCTVIGNAYGATVATVEHLMAALAAAGVDNARVCLDGPEVPILDGSAAPWMALIERAGLRMQARRQRRLQVLRPLRVEANGKWAMLVPARGSRFSVEIDFSEPLIGRQRCDFDLRRGSFTEQIAPARTFGFADQVAAMQAAGRALGGSLENAVVIGNGRVLNPGGLRFADEFVRHKLLDCIGDLYLAGAPIEGRLLASRPGHALNVQLLRRLFAREDAWCWTEGAEDQTRSLALAA